MYDILEQTADELRAHSLVRVSERLEEHARFFGSREKRFLEFGDRGLLPLSEGDIYRTTYRRPHRKQNPSTIVLKLFGFDEKHYGEDRAVVGGVWGPEYSSRSHTGGRVRYMGTIDLLPQDLVQDAIALLEHRGGVDIERAPWEDD